MSEYTAEDFAQATFARHENGRKAMRIGGDRGIVRWWLGKYGGASDEGMAAGGWVPVVEVEDWKKRIDDLTAAHDDVRNLLKDTADDLRHNLALARDELSDLRKERDELRTIEDELHAEIRGLRSAPITLHGLAAAWEAAEVPTDDAPMRQGDVYISTFARNDRGLGYLVAAAGRNGTHMHFNARILSRAPREPWQDLADDLADRSTLMGDIEAAAKALHKAGWRKGGDES